MQGAGIKDYTGRIQPILLFQPSKGKDVWICFLFFLKRDLWTILTGMHNKQLSFFLKILNYYIGNNAGFRWLNRPGSFLIQFPSGLIAWVWTEHCRICLYTQVVQFLSFVKASSVSELTNGCPASRCSMSSFSSHVLWPSDRLGPVSFWSCVCHSRSLNFFVFSCFVNKNCCSVNLNFELPVSCTESIRPLTANSLLASNANGTWDDLPLKKVKKEKLISAATINYLFPAAVH